MCGGPSSQQTQIAGQQQQLFSSLQNAYGQMFAGQTQILSSLQSSFAPILAAGINQYGYSPQENAALRTQATSGVANQYQQANQATQEQLAATGGGNEFLPTGAASQLTQQNALAAAQQQSAEQLGITQAGYEQGRQNYLGAAQGLGSVASAMNPLGYAGAATGGGQAAYGSAQQNATQAAQTWASIGGAVGGTATAALGAGK
ncbi:MAG: hypothetical protein WCA27_07360 [Candidatus Sulfotelmatobacter sp.]